MSSEASDAPRELLLITEPVRSDAAAFERRLSSDERRRAERYVFERDRRLSVTAHSLKRLAIARLLDVPAEQLRFGRSARGRPFLAFPEATLDFNLSHSGTRVALAIGRGCRVGVDIEAPTEGNDHLLSAIRHDDERELFPDEADFPRAWSLKEALSKAIGVGLHRDFTELGLRRAGGEDGWPYRHGRWFCRHETLEDGYHVALASDRPYAVRVVRLDGTDPRLPPQL